MANKKIQKDPEWEVIGVKRKWTYAPIILFMVFGLFLCTAIFNLDEFVTVFLIGLIIVAITVFLLVIKILTPTDMIMYSESLQMLKIRTWIIRRDVAVKDLSGAQASWRFADVVFCLKTKKLIVVTGIARGYDIEERMSKIIRVDE